MSDQFNTDVIQPGSPAWRIALLFPRQGSWTVQDFLALDAGRLVEFDQGCVEVHDLPTAEHQRIVQFIYRTLFAYLETVAAGEVFVAPLPVRLWHEKFREPDVVFIAASRNQFEGYPDGADLVVEVVSEDPISRKRDMIDKVVDYARAGIQEYWIIDRLDSEIRVGVLENDHYEFTVYTSGQQATSTLLPNFTLNVNQTLEASRSSSK
jgi:Uma2 family endonuclease